MVYAAGSKRASLAGVADMVPELDHVLVCVPDSGTLRRLVARLGGRALFTFVLARVLRRFPAYTSRHMARLAGRVTVDDVTTLRTTAYRYTSRAQSATREPM